MLDRRARLVGIRLIETALAKHADAPQILTPTLSGLKASKTKELNKPSGTAAAVIPRVLSSPT